MTLSLLSLWLVKDLEASLAEKPGNTGNIQSESPSVLGTEKPQSNEEILENYRQRNEDLKERSLEISPNKRKSAYFQNKFTEDSKNIGDSDYVSVIVEQEEKQETVFQEDYHLSSLEWLDDREIVVYRSCGTECMIAYIVDTETKKQQEITMGVGYTWSPNKQYVVAYHYSYKYGISVANRGDEYGQTVFQVRREHPPTGSGLTSKTQVAWAPDSTKLAIVIRKDNEEKLELIVIDIKKAFKTYYHQDLANNDISGLAWEGLSTLIVKNEKGYQKIAI